MGSLFVLLPRSGRPSTVLGLVVGACLIILGGGIGSLLGVTRANLSFLGGCVGVIVCGNAAWLGMLGCMLLVDGA